VAYSHPEAPIEVDSIAFGRNYFNGENEDNDERAQILAEAAMFKELASDYMHPEAKVENIDSTVFGRNYFNRPDAPELSSMDEAEERVQILADVALLKKHAASYCHPEAPVVVDCTAFGRNYFTATCDMDEEERAQILAEAAMFKKLASDYMHPEAKVENTDATLFGRNYFNRSDAPELFSMDEADERAQILADATLLKKQDTNYAHPESPVEVDCTAFGRNYFTTTFDVDEDEEERAKILAEAAMFKKLASDYTHPEAKVENTDATLFGRNYFNRSDAPELSSMDAAEERAQILADVAILKKRATNYAHPESPMEVDSTVFGRNYFTATYDMNEDEEERAQILADSAMFKKLASDYLHPEAKVENCDATLFGRNYFIRPDASELSSMDEAEERAQILADAALLKQSAVSCSHPEAPIIVDSTAFGRNYFTAPSCTDEDEDERAQILAEAGILKQLSIGYLHPEAKVESTDAALFGRNYFNRPDAPKIISNEEAEERACVLSEVEALKKVATDYAHPEVGVTTSDSTAFARNFFHTAAVSDDSKISSHAEDCLEAPVHDEEHIDHHDHEMFEFDDYDQFTDMRQELNYLNQPKKPLPHAASFADFAHSTIEIKGDDEEGHLSRSPSCVAFFNYF